MAVIRKTFNTSVILSSLQVTVRDHASSMSVGAAGSAGQQSSTEATFPIFLYGARLWCCYLQCGLQTGSRIQVWNRYETSYLISFLRCPNIVMVFYEVVKYVVSHTLELGVDPSRIAIAGESGGG